MATDKDLKIELTRAYLRIEELERLVKSLSYQAFVDDMTGLPNYRAFCHRLDQMIAEANRGRAFCMVMIDVDHFKKVNDTFGHQVGDDVLRHVAEALRGAAREVDFVGRYGGEEFVMLLPEANLEGAYDAAERARAALENNPFGCIKVTASFGICAFSKGMDQDSLKKAADGALYQAKESGRNRVVGVKG